MKGSREEPKDEGGCTEKRKGQTWVAHTSMKENVVERRKTGLFETNENKDVHVGRTSQTGGGGTWARND